MEAHIPKYDLFREYLTNVIYNPNPLQKRGSESHLSDTAVASEKVRQMLYTIDLASVERCIIQLLYLLSLRVLDPKNSALDLSLRSIKSIDLILIKVENPCPAFNEASIIRSFEEAVFEQCSEGYFMNVLKLVVKQSNIEDCEQEGFNGWHPLSAFHRTLEVLRPLIEYSPEQSVEGTNYRYQFANFFSQVQTITKNAPMEEIRKELEKKSSLINQNSCYCAMKNSCLSEKVLQYNREVGSIAWREINLSTFQDIIGISIKQLVFPQGNYQQLKALARQEGGGGSKFYFYYSEHPDTGNTNLEIIEFEHSNLPKVEASHMQRLNECFMDHRQSIRRHQSGRLLCRRNLGPNTVLAEKELLNIMERLYMRTNILRIRLNTLISNQMTLHEIKEEVAHYDRMVQYRYSRLEFNRQHQYVEELRNPY